MPNKSGCKKLHCPAINLAICHKNSFIFPGAGSRVELSGCSLFARVAGISGIVQGTKRRGRERGRGRGQLKGRPTAAGWWTVGVHCAWAREIREIMAARIRTPLVHTRPHSPRETDRWTVSMGPGHHSGGNSPDNNHLLFLNGIDAVVDAGPLDRKD